MFPNVQVSNTLSSHFLRDRQLCPTVAATNQHGCCFARTYMLARQCGGVRASGERVCRNRGESFLVSVPAIVMSLWKLMPVVRGQGPLSWVCLYQWKNTHLALGPQSAVRLDHISEKNPFPMKNTLTQLEVETALYLDYKRFFYHASSRVVCINSHNYYKPVELCITEKENPPHLREERARDKLFVL